MKKLVIILALLGIAGAGGFWYVRNASGQHKVFKTVPVERGTLEATISATGTLEPEEVVDIGAQVAGLITKFGKDVNGKVVDYGSEVTPLTVLAEIDPRIYKAQMDQANANLKRARADLIQMKAKLIQSERDWRRAQKLGPGVDIAHVDYDTAWATYETAKANVGVDEAAIAQAQSAYDQAKINLDYCTIRSPVKGVIVDRRVNIGQTVISSLNAPSLFLLAKDLKKMQIWAQVNEADIGQIAKGQKVTFTVDAFAGEAFLGNVNQIRLNATMTQNVVTYTVVVDTDNSDGRLLPYMTANLKFHVKQRKEILKVANSALRWIPDAKDVLPEARDAFQSKGRGSPGAGSPAAARGPYPGSPGTPARRGGAPGPRPAPGGRQQGPPGQVVTQPLPVKEPLEFGLVWVEENGFVRPIHVKVGLTDGSMTEISNADKDSEEIKEGMRVVIGEVRAFAGDQAANPFTPQFFNRNRNQQQQQQRGGR
jgi:HlyD family secretion protein